MVTPILFFILGGKLIMKEFNSIFHEENIPVPKYNPQNTKINMNVSISQKNYPRLKQLVDSEQKNDIKNNLNIAKKQIEAQKHAAASTIKESYNIPLLDSITLI